MEPLSAISALAPLIIDWAKERRSQGKEADEDEFRLWFRDVALPELLSSSTAAYRSIVASQKAHHTELVGYITDEFAKVRSTLQRFLEGQPRVQTFDERWQELGLVAHDLLDQLLKRVSSETYEDSNLTTPFDVKGASEDDIEAARKRLVEAGLADYSEGSGSAILRLTGLGFLVTQATIAPEDFQAALLRIQHGMRTYRAAPIDKLVAHCWGRYKPAFVFAVVERWDQLGWVSLQILDQRPLSRVSHPAQQMLDASADDLKKGTLRRFLDT